jgi:hypothetical protein
VSGGTTLSGQHEIVIPARDIPEDLTDVACKLAYFVSPEVVSVRRASPDAFQVGLSSCDAEQAEAVARDVRVLLERLVHGYRPLQLRTLFGPAAEPPLVSAGGEDLTAQLLERGWVHQHGAGLWSLGPELSGLLEAIDAIVHDVVREVYGAPNHAFPALIATDTLRRAGYLTSFPQNVGFVSHLPQNLDSLLRFQEASAAGAAPVDGALAAPEECLPPAVCYHRFRELSGRTLAEGSVITARGICFRYEARHNMRSLVRLWSFQMREVIYAGDEDYVRGMAERATTFYEAGLAAMGLIGSCESATDPFFVNIFGPKRYAQVAGELKFELRLALGAGESLAAGSTNLHQEHFGKAFAIRCEDGAPVTSGCTAFGLERTLLGFLAQHGFDPAHWPDAVVARTGRDGFAG